MVKRFDISDMPPQSEELHETVHWIERKYCTAIEKCIAGYDLLDPSKVVEVTRTYATQFFDAYYDFYSQFPEHEKRWLEASVYSAMTRVVQHINNYYAVRDHYSKDESLLMHVEKTIEKHGRSKQPPKLEKVFLTPGSKFPNMWTDVPTEHPTPLLLKPVKESDPIPRIGTNPSHARRSFVEPILYEKGWSISDWAKKAKVATHTATDYLAGKTNPHPYNRKNLADALGISIQQLPK
jgi:hypothetical protein